MVRFTVINQTTSVYPATSSIIHSNVNNFYWPDIPILCIRQLYRPVPIYMIHLSRIDGEMSNILQWGGGQAENGNAAISLVTLPVVAMHWHVTTFVAKIGNDRFPSFSQMYGISLLWLQSLCLHKLWEREKNAFTKWFLHVCEAKMFI